ncbi:MAG TPA: hypothetical protein VIV40_42350 [Kofleriaceae bacterium]
MSHDHTKKHHHHHDDKHKKKHHHHHDDDKGKLSDAMKNKRDPEDETTPGNQAVTSDSKQDIKCDVVALLPANDPYDKNLLKITVNAGSDDGVLAEMRAYLLGPDGTRYELNVADVLATATRCYADLSEAFITKQTTMRVVFNPSK